MPRVPPEVTEENAAALLGWAAARWPVLMVGPPPLLHDAAHDARAAALSDRLGALCDDMDLPFLAVHAPLSAGHAWRNGAARGDGVHPDGGGYAALAALVDGWAPWRALVDGLARIRQRACNARDVTRLYRQEAAADRVHAHEPQSAVRRQAYRGSAAAAGANSRVAAQLITETTTAPHSAGQNPATSKPGTSQLVRPSIAAFTTSRNRPSVTSVSGSDSSTSTGRTTALTRPKTSAVSSSQKTPRTSIPGTSCVAAQSAKAVMKVRAQKPMRAVSANPPRSIWCGAPRTPNGTIVTSICCPADAASLAPRSAPWPAAPRCCSGPSWRLLARLAQPLPPLLLTGLAFAVGGTLGLIVVAARGRLGALRQPPLVWLHGVGGLAGYHALYFAALALAPPVEANLLNYTWPLLIVLLAAPLRGLRLGPRRLAGVGLGAAGAVLLLAGRRGDDSGGRLRRRRAAGLCCWRSPPG